MNTTNLVSTPEITGNIGSCSVQSNTSFVDALHKQTVVINSCSGEIISQSTYLDIGIIFAVLGLTFLFYVFFLRKWQ